MPRNSSGGRSTGFGRSRGFFTGNPSRSSYTASKPMAPTTRPIIVQQPVGSFGGGLGSTLATGMAFGAGSEIAHQAVRGLTGGNSYMTPTQAYETQPNQQPYQAQQVPIQQQQQQQ